MIGHNRIGSSAYTNSTPKANLAAEAAKEFANPPAAIVEQAGDYECIKARIDNAIERQKDGRKALALAIREMLETKAYRTKYKTMAAFALHEYGKSPRWITHQLEELTGAYTGDKDESAETPKSTDAIDKKELAALKQVEQAREEKEEEEKPAVHSADEVKREEAKPANNGQNGKPKHSLAIWNELETSLGRSLNRADELNRMCPNPTLHSQFLAVTKSCMALLAKWRESVK